MESVQLLVVCLGEAFACRLTSYQVHSLQLAKEQHRDEEEGGDQRHYYTGGAAILVPRMHITILDLLHDIVNELELKVYLNVEKDWLDRSERIKVLTNDRDDDN